LPVQIRNKGKEKELPSLIKPPKKPSNESIYTSLPNRNSREKAAAKRLTDYEVELVGKEEDSILTPTAEGSSNKPLEFISEQALITKWASKFPNIRENPQEIANLVIEINNSPKGPIQQKPLMNTFIKIEARSRDFFAFSKTSELKLDHQLEFESLERKFHENYKKYHKISQLNRGIREKIKNMISASIFIAYLRFIRIHDLDAYWLAQILEYGCNYLCKPREGKKTDYYNLLQACKRIFQETLPQLPEDPSNLHSHLKMKVLYNIPILDRSTTSEVVRSLRHYYSFTQLPESYFVTLPPLPDDPKDLPEKLTHLFPIKERKVLKELGQRIRELKNLFIVPSKIPDSYFDLPPPKIPLPSSYEFLDKEFLYMFPLDTTEYRIRDVVRDLRKKYFFKQLPENFFKEKRPLPRDPLLVKNLSNHILTIPTTNKEDTQQLINLLKQNYRFFLPLGPQWVAPSVSQTNKPKLPAKIQDVDPNLNLGQFISKDENLRDTLKKLHQTYEFFRIPENWFEIPRLPLPEDVRTINRILKERDTHLQVPLTDDDLLLTQIAMMRKIFYFNRLPENLIIKETLPEPEFDLAPSFC